VLSSARMGTQPERDELCDAIDVLAIQLRAQRALWIAREDQACVTALERLLGLRARAADPAEELEAMLDRMRQETIAVARELEGAATDHGKPKSRADSIARRAILELLMTITDLEDEVHEAREPAADRRAAGRPR
jgi:hypothetical protein